MKKEETIDQIKQNYIEDKKLVLKVIFRKIYCFLFLGCFLLIIVPFILVSYKEMSNGLITILVTVGFVLAVIGIGYIKHYYVTKTILSDKYNEMIDELEELEVDGLDQDQMYEKMLEIKNKYLVIKKIDGKTKYLY